MDDEFGPRRRALLKAWSRHVATEATGPDFDFTDTNRTATTAKHVDAFLESPTEERFERLWTREVVADSVMGGPSVVVDGHGGSIDAVAGTIAEIQRADEYDADWGERFLVDTVVWELYGRLHPEREPILNSECVNGLKQMGFTRPTSFTEARKVWEAFESEYRSVSGYATAGCDHQVPLAHEISEFLWFVAVNDPDVVKDVLLDDVDEYLPIAGWQSETPLEQDVRLAGHEKHIDGYVEAERKGGLEKEGPEDLWNQGYWEDWKDAYLEHMETVVQPRYDLTELSAAEVEPLLDDLAEKTTLSTTIPSYMLGGRSGGILWSNFRERSSEKPDEAAAVLSYLFDESEDLTLRLDRFAEFYGSLTTGGPLMSLATLLLTFAYPEEYVFYKYSLMSGFFDRFSDYHVRTGFNADQYWKLNLACRNQILDPLRERLDEKEPTLLDVYTLLYVWDGNHNEG